MAQYCHSTIRLEVAPNNVIINTITSDDVTAPVTGHTSSDWIIYCALYSRIWHLYLFPVAEAVACPAAVRAVRGSILPPGAAAPRLTQS